MLLGRARRHVAATVLHSPALACRPWRTGQRQPALLWLLLMVGMRHACRVLPQRGASLRMSTLTPQVCLAAMWKRWNSTPRIVVGSFSWPWAVVSWASHSWAVSSDSSVVKAQPRAFTACRSLRRQKWLPESRSLPCQSETWLEKKKAFHKMISGRRRPLCAKHSAPGAGYVPRPPLPEEDPKPGFRGQQKIRVACSR